WDAFARMAFDIDVRDVVPTIHVPTLILHAVEDRICQVGNARWLASHLEGARYVELPGADHVPWFDPEETLAEIREFLTGSREPRSDGNRGRGPGDRAGGASRRPHRRD